MTEREFIEATVAHLEATNQADGRFIRDDVVAYVKTVNEMKAEGKSGTGRLVIATSWGDEITCLNECETRNCFAKNYKLAFGEELPQGRCIGNYDYWA